MSVDSITLETAEERELWRAVFPAALHIDGHHHAGLVADAAVRAYRERLPKPGDLAEAEARAKRAEQERDALSTAMKILASLVTCSTSNCDNPAKPRASGMLWCDECEAGASDENWEAEVDVAPEPLSRGEVNGAPRDNGANLEVKPWPAKPSGVPDAPGSGRPGTPAAASAHGDRLAVDVSANRDDVAAREDLSQHGHIRGEGDKTVSDDCAKGSHVPKSAGATGGAPDAPGWWWLDAFGEGKHRPVRVWAERDGLWTCPGKRLEDERVDEIDPKDWGGPCTRGDSGDASKLQAELTALRERLGEVADGLQRRRSECDGLAKSSYWYVDRARCRGAASAYGYAAELLRGAMREDP